MRLSSHYPSGRTQHGHAQVHKDQDERLTILWRASQIIPKAQAMTMQTIRRSVVLHTLSFFFITLINHANAASNVSAVLPLTATAYGTTLTTVVQIGGQSFKLLPDTGSADLWVLQPGWECYRGHHTRVSVLVDQAECAYGNVTYSKTSTFTPINDARLGVHYGEGDVFGSLGLDTMQVGDIVVPQQQFGLVESTNGPADNYSDGLMGLGYSILSMTHPSNYTATSALGLLSNTLWYRTAFWGMAEVGMEPYFAVALDRIPFDQEIGDGGYISFGTMPPVAYSSEWITTPVEITETIPASFTNGTQKITEWTATVESVTWSGNTYDVPWQAVVDTGNYFFNVPNELARDFNAAFDPPAVYDEDGSLGPVYSVQCSATPPTGVGFQLGGKMFSIDRRDMIWRDYEGNCFSTVAPSGSLGSIELFFLGDFFLRNVVAVFDFGADEMRFAERIHDSNSSSPGSQPTPIPATGGASSLEWSWLSFALVCVVGCAAVL